MSDNVELPTSLVCPQCGAQQLREMKLCWLCNAKIEANSSESSKVGQRGSTPSRISFSLSTLLLLLTLASVCLGLLAVAPGLGIPLCVLLVPVLIRTTMVVRRREAIGLPVSRIEKIGLMTSSLGVATIVAVVVAVAAFCSFCGVCLLVVSAGNKHGGSGMFLWGLGVCALAAWLVLMVVRSSKWIRRRYRRDVGEG